MSKVSIQYQLQSIQHTMRCLRGVLDTIWDCWTWGESFPHKKEITNDVDKIRDMIKALEEKAHYLQRTE